MKTVAYIGCYTDEKKEGIHLVEVDTDRGDLEHIGVVEGVENATYLARATTRPLLYASQRMGDSGAVAVYAVRDDRLRLLGRRPVNGGVPCHVALDPRETRLVFAEYSGARAGVFTLREDGEFSEVPPVTVRHRGHGPDPERQTAAHAHCARVSPDGRYLYVADLGIDRVVAYAFSDPGQKTLPEVPAMSIQTAPGSGPRHLLFHPNGRLAFLLHELDNTISSFRYDGETMVRVQTISMLPPDFHGFSKAAAIKLSEDGRRLFGSNRGHDSIAVFDLDAVNGKMTLANISKLAGSFPRDFEFAPGGKFALVGHENSNEIMAYRFRPDRGDLIPAGPPLAMHRPVCIQFEPRRNNG